MLVLGIDSAGHACAACVWRDGEVLSVSEEPMERGQDARLVPLVLNVMAKASVEFSQIDRFAATRGPGSFTGLRIGLAAARGFGLATGKPVVGVDRFSIHKEQQKSRTEDVLAVLDSKRRELFCRLYPARGIAGDAALLAPEEIAELVRGRSEVVICGDSNCILRPLLPDSALFVETREPEVITCARLAFSANLEDQDFLPRPLYLRAPDVTGPKSVRESLCVRTR